MLMVPHNCPSVSVLEICADGLLGQRADGGELGDGICDAADGV